MLSCIKQLKFHSKYFLVAGVFVAGLLAGVLYGFFNYGQGHEPEIRQVRQDSSEYKYINPLIYIDNSSFVYENLNPLKDDLEEYLEEQIENQKIKRASVYYRDMNTGAWTGVKPDDKYVPASIMKVATMMVYLREAEDNPTIMDELLAYKKDPNELQNYPPSYELEDGYYKVHKLLGQSLVESDNAAERALSQGKEQGFSKLFSALRLPIRPVKMSDFMSSRDVSRIFRSLYSSTYLLDSYSEQALAFLTKTSFNKGITAAVPSDISVAHKFGEHTVYYLDPRTPPTYQLHDCGIVYYPKKPYLICVMTEGVELADLEESIRGVSKIAFLFVKETN